MKSNTLAVSVIALAALPFITDSAEASSSTDQNYSSQPGTGYVDATSLNVRSEPSTSSKILGSLAQRASISILGQSGNWYKIQYNNKEAYVHKSYVSLSSSQGTKQYIVNADALNVRNQPSAQSSVVGLLQNGQIITVQSKQNGWYKISYNGKTAYVKKEFVSSASKPQVKSISSSNEIKPLSPSSYYVDCAGLRLRTGPGTNYQVLKVLDDRQEVQIIGETGAWYKVRYGGIEGFASKEYVKPLQSPSQAASAFVFPAAAGNVSSPFGMRWGSMHYGVDLAASGNVQIYAAAAGTVSRSYYSSSYGNVVFVKHKISGQLYTTVYAHMKSRSVKEGDTVKQGQLLGYMGNTGQSFGQHLHFELHKGEWNLSKTNAIDPLPYIKR